MFCFSSLGEFIEDGIDLGVHLSYKQVITGPELWKALPKFIQ